eukprot:scaffold2215_cov162-Amphora_coffeaeformis.AAC.13
MSSFRVCSQHFDSKRIGSQNHHSHTFIQRSPEHDVKRTMMGSCAIIVFANINSSVKVDKDINDVRDASLVAFPSIHEGCDMRIGSAKSYRFGQEDRFGTR